MSLEIYCKPAYLRTPLLKGWEFQKSVSAAELGPAQGKLNLIDVREKGEYKGGHIPGAKNIPMSDLLGHPEKYLNKETEYHIVCHSGARSRRTSGKLSKLGYKIVNVSDGTMSYPNKLKK
jgi:rhodanese-related sulfurtransferase